MADVFLVVMARCISNDKLAGGGVVENGLFKSHQGRQ